MKDRYAVQANKCVFGSVKTREEAADYRLFLIGDSLIDSDRYEVVALVDPEKIVELLYLLIDHSNNDSVLEVLEKAGEDDLWKEVRALVDYFDPFVEMEDSGG